MADNRVLLDTGPLVALLHADDSEHQPCKEFLENFRGALFTTEAILTESMYLLEKVKRGTETCLEFFIRGGATLVPQSQASLIRCKALMAEYADLPMDYADATLIALAEEFGIRSVFTLDHRGFGVYRLKGKTPPVIVP